MLMEHIIMFNKIASEQSISKVAQANHISQPALSQQMQKLEEELGVKLLERSNRGITLTKAGQVMLKYSSQFMGIYEDLKEELGNLRVNNGTFRIASTAVACNYALPCALHKVRARFPQFTFNLNCVNSNETIYKVLNNQADLGFIVGKTEEKGLICNFAFSDKIYLLAHSSYKIKDSITLEDLSRFPLVMLNENFSSYRLVQQYLKEQGYPTESMNVMYHLDSSEAVKSFVLAGYGLAFLPYMTVKKELYQNQLRIIEVKDFDLNYEVFSIYRNHGDCLDRTVQEINKYFVSTVNKNIC